MLGWIKCFAAIGLAAWMYRWLINYKPRKVYPRNRHFCEVKFF